MTQYTVWHQEVCQAGMAEWYDTIHRVVVWKASMACVLLLEAAFLIRPCLKLCSYMGRSRREKLRMLLFAQPQQPETETAIQLIHIRGTHMTMGKFQSGFLNKKNIIFP